MQPFIVMNVGSVIARGAPDEVLSNPKSLPLLEDDDA
jgi:ABC-type branched-subunit amino acid transport system ATPase component